MAPLILLPLRRQCIVAGQKSGPPGDRTRNPRIKSRVAFVYVVCPRLLEQFDSRVQSAPSSEI
jgi:hypothetical protein